MSASNYDGSKPEIDTTATDGVLNRALPNQVAGFGLTCVVSCDYATVRGTLFYGITVANSTDSLATRITLTGQLNDFFDDLQFTLDGESWAEWTDSIELDDMPAGQFIEIIIRGTVRKEVVGSIKNTARVEATFCKDEEEI